MANLYACWIGVLLGILAGAVQGLFFHREDWLGGYASWPRRMVRLGHISFFGLAFINLAFVVTVRMLEGPGWSALPSVLLIIGAATMPLCCYLSAWRPALRHLFPVPVLSTASGVAFTLFSWVLQR